MEVINVLCQIEFIDGTFLLRFDLAFDIFNRPEIVNLQHIKGGVTHNVFYGRGWN